MSRRDYSDDVPDAPPDMAKLSWMHEPARPLRSSERPHADCSQCRGCGWRDGGLNEHGEQIAVPCEHESVEVS